MSLLHLHRWNRTYHIYHWQTATTYCNTASSCIIVRHAYHSYYCHPKRHYMMSCFDQIDAERPLIIILWWAMGAICSAYSIYDVNVRAQYAVLTQFCTLKYKSSIFLTKSPINIIFAFLPYIGHIRISKKTSNIFFP